MAYTPSPELKEFDPPSKNPPSPSVGPLQHGPPPPPRPATPLPPLPPNDVAVGVPFPFCLAVNVLATANCGTFVVSRLSVPAPPLPPPSRSVPAVTLVIVPGNGCPGAKVNWPLLLILSPVSD